jgi:hypothetical protein
MRTRALAAAAVLAALLVIPMASLPAVANDSDVERSGNCGGRSDWKLKLSPEDGGIEVEFEVDQNKVGRRWKVGLRHDGYRFFRGIRTTKGPSGSFEVRRVINNTRGKDGVTAFARNLRSGEVCRGAASI